MRGRSSWPPSGTGEVLAGSDPELVTIFREEMARHLSVLERTTDGDTDRAARALHAMKGAAAMMGYNDLAASLHDVDLALRAGDVSGTSLGLQGLSAVLVAHGVSAPDLSHVAAMVSREPSVRPAQKVDDEILGFFVAEARGRLQSVAQNLSIVESAADRTARRAALDAALRDVHAVKGAAGTVGASVIARGAHAVEGALAALRGQPGEVNSREIAALRKARDRLALALADDLGGARAVDELVDGLRTVGLLREQDVPVTEAQGESAAARGTDVVHVSAQTLARLAEAVSEVGLVHGRMARHAGSVHDLGRLLHRVGMTVESALRRIGPARPWGAPAEALRELAGVGTVLAREGGAMEREAQGLQHDAELLGTLSAGARDALKGLSAVTTGWLFDHVALVVETAAGAHKSVRVVREGEGIELDRGIAERLVEPLSQMVRNAVAHGIERPASRLAAGKSARATIRLTAVASGDTVRIAVEDDGAGVDVAAVRARAVAVGLVAPGVQLSDEIVLEALFEPGVSTRARAETDAGRGVGLDLVRQEVRALGGTVRVRSTPGVGAVFELEITQRPAVQRVVRVRAAGACVAIPLGCVRKVERVGDTAALRVVSLAGLFGAETVGDRVVVLSSANGEIGMRVETVEAPYEIVVRAMPEMLSGLGPWGAAAVDGEGRVTLVLDPDGL